MMVQEIKISLCCDKCGEPLNYGFGYQNDTVGDDIITLSVDTHECKE